MFASSILLFFTICEFLPAAKALEHPFDAFDRKVLLFYPTSYIFINKYYVHSFSDFQNSKASLCHIWQIGDTVSLKKKFFLIFIRTLDGTVNGKSNDITFPNLEKSEINQETCIKNPGLIFEICETDRLKSWTAWVAIFLKNFEMKSV